MVEATRSYPDSSNCEAQEERSFLVLPVTALLSPWNTAYASEEAALEDDQFDSVS